MENPWNIQSLYEYQYFNCPVCTYKNHSKQKFVIHTYEFHPESTEFFMNINDESLLDIVVPWNETKVDIKEEEEITDTSDKDLITSVPIHNINDKKIQNFQRVVNQIHRKNILKSQDCSNQIIPNWLQSPQGMQNIIAQQMQNFQNEKFNIDPQNFQYEKFNTNPQNFQYEKFNKDPQNFQYEKFYKDPQNLVSMVEVKLEESNTDVFENEDTETTENDFKSIKVYSCHLCFKNFGDKGNLRRHRRIVHEGARNFKCETCGKEFSTKSNLKANIKFDFDF